MKKIVTGFFMAWGTFLSVPCPTKKWDEKSRKWMVALMQTMGLIVGVVQCSLFLFGDFLTARGVIGDVYLLKAAVLTAMPFVLTGFIHLDGYMDCSDAILSRKDLAQRREILKDSRVGSFAVVMAIIAFMCYFASVTEILYSNKATVGMVSLIIVGLLARGLASLDVLTIESLETSQYAQVGEKSKNIKYIAVCGTILIIGVAVSIFFSRVFFDDMKIIGAGIISTFIGQKIASKLAVSDLEGMSGDIAGFTIVSGEVIGVIGIALVC